MKSHVSMEKAICPVCFKEHDTGAILLDTRLRKRFETYTTTGYKLCTDCDSKHKEGYIIFVVCDDEKSITSDGNCKLEDAYRTGEVMYIREEVVKKLFNVAVKGPLAFIKKEAAKLLKEKYNADTSKE